MNVVPSAKIQKKVCVKKVILLILLHVVLKIVDTQKALLTIQLYVNLKKQQKVL